MLGEIIAIGDELLCGKSLDTNSRWLAERLSDCGVAIHAHSTVGDSLLDCAAALELARSRSRIVVCTGGLGPTEDDLTRAALARVASVELEFDEASWEHIRALFGRRGRAVPEKNRVQAMFPRGSRIIPNAHGTAPGIDLMLESTSGESCRIFALPGVPAEMELIWRSYVEPEIRQLAGARQMVQRTLRCFGAGESDIEQMIPADVMARGRDPLVGITASDATISLRVATYASSVSEGVSLIEPTLAAIRAALGELVYGQDDETLADAVIARLAARNETIAVVDLGLRGLVAQWLSESDPGGTVCLGTIDFRTPGSARRLFPQATADFPTSLDLERLARDVRDFWSAGLGVAIGPIPQPPQDESNAEFHIGVASDQRSSTSRFRYAGHPAHRRARAAKQVLNHLRLQWLSH